MLDWLKSLLGLAGQAVDSAVPVQVGSRTQWAVLLCAMLPAVMSYVPAQYKPLVVAFQGAVCTATPVLAAAHFVRGMGPAVKK